MSRIWVDLLKVAYTEVKPVNEKLLTKILSTVTTVIKNY